MISFVHRSNRRGLVALGAALLAITFMIVPQRSHAQWSKVNAPGIAGNYFWWIEFESATTGYAIASKSTVITIYKTTNGGATWSALYGMGLVPFTIHFLDENTGFAAGRAAGCKCLAISRTTDGGVTWELDSVRNLDGSIAKVAAGYGIHAISFADEMTGYAGGADGSLLRTTDRGATWQRLNSGNSTDNVGIVSSGVPGVAYGVAGTADSRLAIYRSADSGATWQRRLDFLSLAIADMVFISADTGFAIGNDGQAAIYKTTDGGTSWQRKYSMGDSMSFVSRITFEDQNVGYAVGSDGLALRTTDGGESWVAEPTGVGDFLQGVTIIDHTVYAISTSGTLIKRTPGAAGITPDGATGENLLLMPNPFTTAATVSHPGLRAAGGELVLYDALGRQARRIKASAGADTFQFERDGLPAGTYLYRLTAGATSLATGTLVVR